MAGKLGVQRVGLTAKEACEYEAANMERLVLVGDQFGDESRHFVRCLDVMWVIGGGKQSEAEAKMAGEMGKSVVLVRGIGGAAEKLTCEDVPGARVIDVSIWFVCMCVCVFVCVCVCVWLCECIYVCVYMYGEADV